MCLQSSPMYSFDIESKEASLSVLKCCVSPAKEKDVADSKTSGLERGQKVSVSPLRIQEKCVRDRNG